MLMICVMALLGAGFGYWWSGCEIASLHRYVHTVKVAVCRASGPKGAVVYMVLHLLHHKDVPRETVLRRHGLSRAQWRQMFERSVLFVLTGPHFIAHLTLIAYRFTQVCAVMMMCAFIAGLPLSAAVLGAVGFLAGAFACLLVYQMCHEWTHVGGPLPSALHVRHHERPSGNFGMWAWHNKVGVRHMQWTIAALHRAEWLLRVIPPAQRRLDLLFSGVLRVYG